MKAWMTSNFGRIKPLTSELSAHEKSMYNVLNTLAHRF